MNFAKEFASVGLHYDCSTCGFSNCSSRGLPYCCTNYFPENMSEVMSSISFNLRVNTGKSHDKRLIRRLIDDRHKMTCDGDTLDKYYVNMINDTLSEIRKGKTAYLFHLSQIQEVMKFEDIDFTYNSNDGCFAVRLNKGDNKNK